MITICGRNVRIILDIPDALGLPELIAAYFELSDIAEGNVRGEGKLPGYRRAPVRAGFLYCMLAEYNHQRVSPHLNEEAHKRALHFMDHTGVKLNSYKQYQKWGSLSSPLYMIIAWILNWGFWSCALYLIGGPGLVCAIFSAAFLWFTLIRAFNYTGHGGGKNKHREGIDFDTSNLSVNQSRPGLLAGEWHNNHHLFPGSARAGFLPGQLDFAWVYIYTLKKLRMVSWYKDSKKEFLKRYVLPSTGQPAQRPDRHKRA